MAAVDQWLADLAPGATVTVTPVVDLTEQISVNAYEAPDRLRRQVEERDHDGCRFPWCGRQGRHDLDHIEPYVDPDEGGPPGQTSTAESREVLPFPPSGEDPLGVDLPARTRRVADLDLTPRPSIHRRPPRHPGTGLTDDAPEPSAHGLSRCFRSP